MQGLAMIAGSGPDYRGNGAALSNFGPKTEPSNSASKFR